MFSFKNKLDESLKFAIENNSYKHYRVIIQCRNIRESIEKKIKALKAEQIRCIPSLNCISAYLSAGSIEKLLENPDIAHIAFDSTAILCGNSVLSSNGISSSEKYKLTGKGIGVGLVDSGTYPHNDLVSPYNKIRKFTDIINNLRYPYDDNGHGTFISGIICGNGVSSKHMYRGIAEDSHLYTVKAFNSIGRGFVSDILYAIELIINDSKEYNIKVICLPFELLEHNKFIISLFSRLFDRAVKNNITVVVPSGNNESREGSIKGIATLQNCITVAGLDTTGQIKPYRYSSAGPYGKLEKPDLSAACVNICSLNTNAEYISERNEKRVYTLPLDKPYTTFSGTSCAAAYISGVCALLLEDKPQLLFKDVLALLKVSCNTLDTHKHFQGSGMLELRKLFQ